MKEYSRRVEQVVNTGRMGDTTTIRPEGGMGRITHRHLSSMECTPKVLVQFWSMAGFRKAYIMFVFNYDCEKRKKQTTFYLIHNSFFLINLKIPNCHMVVMVCVFLCPAIQLKSSTLKTHFFIFIKKTFLINHCYRIFDQKIIILSQL